MSSKMTGLTFGEASHINSNATSNGGIQADQIGQLIPNMLESLQESSYATQLSSLYYNEKFGSFNIPSSQSECGVHNKVVDGITRFGETGQLMMDPHGYWKGPFILKASFPIQYRYYPMLISTFAESINPNIYSFNAQAPYDFDFAKPKYFASWGAGFALIKTVRMNLGGAGIYQLSSDANWMAIMASCSTSSQRKSLMKLSGDGFINHTPDEDLKGCLFEVTTATVGNIENLGFKGVPYDGNFGGYGEQNWIDRYIEKNIWANWYIPIKTPHTNYNNPLHQRKPIESKLLSEQFTFDIYTNNFDQLFDSGRGCSMWNASLNYLTSAAGEAQFNYADKIGTSDNNVNTFIFGSNLDAGNAIYAGFTSSFPSWSFRQWDGQNTVEYPKRDIEFTYNQAFDNTINNEAIPWAYLNDQISIPFSDLFTPEISKELESSILTSNTTPELRMTHISNNLKLTNPQLGAYDVLQQNPKLAVYYPFQHYTSQSYFVLNTKTFGQSINEYVSYKKTIQDYSTDTPYNVPINIPVNPLTAMYVCIFREKDRLSNPISGLNYYSPMLHWLGLEAINMTLKYNSQPLFSYSNTAEIFSMQLHEKINVLQVPFKAGMVQRKQNPDYVNMRTNAFTDNVYNIGRKKGMTDFKAFPGVYHFSNIYEFLLVERDPLKREEVFLQTDSFLGQQLDFSFYVLPTLYPHDVNDCDYYQINDLNVHQPNIYEATTSKGALLTQTYPQGISKQIGESKDSWNLNNSHYLVTITYAQNALWQLNPLATKILFVRGS